MELFDVLLSREQKGNIANIAISNVNAVRNIFGYHKGD